MDVVNDHTTHTGQEIHTVAVAGCAGESHIANRHGATCVGQQLATGYGGHKLEVVSLLDGQVQVAGARCQGRQFGAPHIRHHIDLAGRINHQSVRTQAVTRVGNATDHARRHRNRAA